jgi:hypothetical protein
VSSTPAAEKETEREEQDQRQEDDVPAGDDEDKERDREAGEQDEQCQPHARMLPIRRPATPAFAPRDVKGGRLNNASAI